MQPTPRQYPRHRSDRRDSAAAEKSGTRDVSIGAAVRGLDRLDAEGPFNGRQGQARRHHKGRRRSLAQRVSGWGDRRHPTCTTRRARVALDRRPPQCKPPKLAAVALANKMARIAWKLMVTGNSYAAEIRARRRGERRIEISQTRGATHLQPC